MDTVMLTIIRLVWSARLVGLHRHRTIRSKLLVVMVPFSLHRDIAGTDNKGNEMGGGGGISTSVISDLLPSPLPREKEKERDSQWHTVFIQSLHAIACINICADTKNPQHWPALPLFGHIKIQHTLGQFSKMECGCPHGRGIKNGHRYKCKFPLPRKKQVYILTPWKEDCSRSGGGEGRGGGEGPGQLRHTIHLQFSFDLIVESSVPLTEESRWKTVAPALTSQPAVQPFLCTPSKPDADLQHWAQSLTEIYIKAIYDHLTSKLMPAVFIDFIGGLVCCRSQ